MAEESSEVTVARPLRLARHGDHLVDAVVELIVGDNAHVRYLSVQEHGPRTWQIALQRAHVGRDASLRSSAVALGGDYARLRSESLLDGRGRRERPASPSTSATSEQMLDFRTLQDHDAPHTRSDLLFKGAVEDDGAARCTRGLIRLRHERAEGERVPDQPQPGAHRGRGRGVDPEPRDRGQRRACSHASTVGPIDDDQLYYLESRGIPPDEAERLIVLGFFDDVFARLPVAVARRAAAPRRVVEKIEHRGAIAMGRVLTSACAPSTTSPPARAPRFDVDGHRLCVVHIDDDCT